MGRGLSSMDCGCGGCSRCGPAGVAVGGGWRRPTPDTVGRGLALHHIPPSLQTARFSLSTGSSVRLSVGHVGGCCAQVKFTTYESAKAVHDTTAALPTQRASFNARHFSIAGNPLGGWRDSCRPTSLDEADERAVLRTGAPTQVVTQVQTTAGQSELCEQMRLIVAEPLQAGSCESAGRPEPFRLANPGFGTWYRANVVVSNATQLSFVSVPDHVLVGGGPERDRDPDYIYTRPYMVRSTPAEVAALGRFDGGTAVTASRANLQQFLDRVSTPTVPFIPPVFTSLAGVVTALSPHPDLGPKRMSDFYVGGGFVDRSGLFHGSGAFDYFLLGGQRERPFPVHAVSDGIVLTTGWNASMGNFAVLEHRNGLATLRTVYHHLVDGGRRDFERARAYVSLCDTAGPRLRTLAACGTMENFREEMKVAAEASLASKPLPSKWGTDNMVLRISAGDSVYRGQQIGWAGDTGYSSGDVHLHFGFAAESPVVPGGRWWWGFDPYGLYGQRECYFGLYPTGEPGEGRLQRESIYAPVMPDHAAVPPNIFRLGHDYYRRIGWSPTTIVPLDNPCGDGRHLFAASYQFGEPDRPARAPIGLAQLQEECTRLTARGWVPRSIQCSIGGTFAATWERAISPIPVLFGVPLGDLGAFWARINAATATLGFRWRLLDVCPYREGGRLLAVVAIDRSELVLPTDPDPAYRIEFDQLPSSFAQIASRLIRENRTATRLHTYDAGGGLRHLFVTRVRLPAEQSVYPTRAVRDQFVQICARDRAQGLQLLDFSPRVIDGKDEYDGILLQTNRPRA